MANTVKRNLSETSTWMRLLYMVLFGILIELALMVMFAIVAIQFLLRLFSGKVNAELQKLGDALGSYMHQIVAFLTYRSDDMPYPFAPWPQAGAVVPGQPAARSRRPRRAKSANPKT